MLTHFLRAAVVIAAVFSCSLAVSQTEYPSKPIRLVIPSPPGSGNDVVGRALAHKLEGALGQPVVVENKAGASGLLAAAAVVRANPDGYTVLLSAPAPIVTQPHLQAMSFDPLNDLIPVTMAVRFSLVWLRKPNLEIKNVSELAEYAKGHPGLLKVGYSGPAGANHLAILMFSQMADVKVMLVPYRGESAAINGLMGGEVDLIVTTITSATGLLQAGRLSPLATTAGTRAQALPDVMTVAESGFPGYSMEGWGGIFVPAKTPEKIIRRLNREITTILRTDEMRTFLMQKGAESAAGTPEEFSAYIRAQSSSNGKLIRDFNLGAN